MAAPRRRRSRLAGAGGIGRYGCRGDPRAPPPAADPGVPALSAAADTIAGLTAARDAERERIRQRDNDIGLLVSSNKALRRELQALKVRRWRDEETIQAIDEE